MTNETIVLMWTALGIGFVHTILGPDHYLPFIAMSKARNWSMSKACLITFLCGLGHIASSVVIGFIGIAFGIAVTKLEGIEAVRADTAAWLLIAFGLMYCIWGVRRAIRNRRHKHAHGHEYEVHVHTHTHTDIHLHSHARTDSRNITPWILFTIFLFGPCEPLIPLVMYPAAQGNMVSVVLVVVLFGFSTVVTMMATVYIVSSGLAKIRLANLERYSHALAGFIIFLCGGAIKFLGL